MSLPRDMERLDDALLALSVVDAEPMLISELDGFLAGILVCPELVMPCEWLPVVLGREEGSPAVLDADAALHKVVKLVLERQHGQPRSARRWRRPPARVRRRHPARQDFVGGPGERVRARHGPAPKELGGHRANRQRGRNACPGRHEELGHARRRRDARSLFQRKDRGAGQDASDLIPGGSRPSISGGFGTPRNRQPCLPGRQRSGAMKRTPAARAKNTRSAAVLVEVPDCREVTAGSVTSRLHYPDGGCRKRRRASPCALIHKSSPGCVYFQHVIH